MRFATILALAGAAMATAPVTVTDDIVVTTTVPCTTSTTTPVVLVTSVPCNTTIAAWGFNTSTTWTSPSATGSVPVVTGGASAIKASVAGLLGFAGVAMLAL